MTFRIKTAMLALASALALATPSGAQLLAGEKEAVIPAIDGIVAAGAKWELAWAGFMTADGMTGTDDGGLLFAQEQSNSIRKLAPDGTEQVYLSGIAGAGAVSIDAKGRLFTVERTCTDPGLNMPSCPELTRVVQLAPERRLLANSFADGRPLGRLNDVMADGLGGAYFTVGGVYRASADGKVSVIAQGSDVFTNGLVLSPDGKTLYVTNRTKILAFDVGKDGATTNRRDFATLTQETTGSFGGDGMAVDSQSRLYVTGGAGIYVFDKGGTQLGVIPVPRPAITLAFSGPDKQTLYVGAMGAVGPDGKPWSTPKGVRNVAMTVYRLKTLTTGFKGRPK
jgi:gluconolactonase